MNPVPPPKSLNGLDKDTLAVALLQYNFLPRQHDHKEELPPIFNSHQFTPQVAEALKKLPRKRKYGYDLMLFKRTRHPNIPRLMGVPHPRAYVELVDQITKSWEKILPLCTSPNSQLEFEYHEDGRMLVHTYNQVADDGFPEDQDPLSDFGMRYLVKTDINSFYPSIYSHAVSWALVGHATAKKNHDRTLWFEKLDASIRFCQRRETKGLPIGPGTSSIIAEALLFPIDAKLREKKYRFTRYIDDYTVFLPDRAACDQFLIDLSNELERYSLSLNLKKTKIIELPVPQREPWVTEIGLLLASLPDLSTGGEQPRIEIRHLRPVMDRALELSKEFPDGSIMKYTLAAIIDRMPVKTGLLRLADDDVERFIEDSLFRHSYFFPTVIPLIQRCLKSFGTFDSRVEDRVEERILKLLSHSFDQGQSDNIVWCLFYLLQLGRAGQQEVADQCAQSGDAMVIAMGYCYAKKLGLELNNFRAWGKEIKDNVANETWSEYDIDRFWLPLYQLFLDDNLDEVPYPEESDQKVFRVLKDRGISFIDFEHSDFGSRLHNKVVLSFGEGLDVIEAPPARKADET